MNCPHQNCGAWARVLRTKSSVGQTERRYECANQHRFNTIETAVGDFGKPAATRLSQRNARIAADLRSMTTADVAKKYGVSRYTVWRASTEKENS